MTQIPLGVAAYSRPYGQLPEIRMENRFFEKNPLGSEQTSLLSRPGTSLLVEVGEGPIRALHTQPGVHNGDLFIVSNQTLYRYNGVDAPLAIDGIVAGSGNPVMTSVAIPEWEALFITDGESLQYYEGESHARATLTITAIAADDVVEINGVYYTFKALADIDSGSPAGTAGNPWRVTLGDDHEESLSNLFGAINGTGTPGSTQSTALDEPHATVRARSLTATTLEVYAIERGTAGNAFTATETGAGTSWSGATFADGGVHELKPCDVPDGQPVTDLATLASFVICAIGDSQRFYWIYPGEVNIQPLDYSSAESEPDHIVNIATVGDQLWIFGESSTESWYASGDADQPFLRNQGRAFSQGILPGTFARVQEAIIVVGQDAVAYRIVGGPERISHHGIEEMLRRWQDSLEV